MTTPKYVTLDDLTAVGLAAADVRERCPGAIQYTAVNGQPCWVRDELVPLLGEVLGRDEP